MGTANVDRGRLASQLAKIISRPEYFEFLQPKYLLDTANALQRAERFVDNALGTLEAPHLRDPIYATELIPKKYPIRIYRVYDGEKKNTASTLGSWWCDRRLLKRCLTFGTSATGHLDHKKTIDAILDAMWVHPTWNGGKDIARMSIPVGSRVPAIVGQGDPAPFLIASGKAVASKSDAPDDIDSDAELYPMQIFVPFFNDLSVTKVPHLSPEWPFGSLS